MIGLFIFVGLLLLVFIGPINQTEQRSYQEVTQQNVSPGRNLLKLPKQLKKNTKQIAVGASFSIGVSKQNELYLWGKYPKAVAKISKDLKGVKKISAGQDHVLIEDETGTLYAFGANRFGQIEVPKKLKKYRGYQQVYAGYQYSIAITKEGEVFFWGNHNLVDVRDEIEEKIRKVAGNTSTVLGLTTKGTVISLGTQESSFSRIPQFKAPIVDLAVTATNAYAVDEKGNLYQWGNYFDSKIESVTLDANEQIKELYAGRYYIVLKTNKGRLLFYEQPSGVRFNLSKRLQGVKANKVYSGLFQFYVENEQGEVSGYGHKGYLLGSDAYGRDVFARLLRGGRLTMTIGFIAVFIETIIGMILGLIAGFYGGKIDNMLMRVTEIVNALPFLPLAMILSALIGNHLSEIQRIYMIMVVLGVLGWPGMARLVRAQILAEKEKEYVIAARAIGLRESKIMIRHLLPNILSFVIVSVTGSFASSMLTESSLSFLGFGVMEPSPTWGNMLTSAKSMVVIRAYWWRWVFPAFALSLATISINLIGDGLRKAFVQEEKE